MAKQFILGRNTSRQSILACACWINSIRPFAGVRGLKSLWYGRHFLPCAASYPGFIAQVRRGHTEELYRTGTALLVVLDVLAPHVCDASPWS